MVLQLPEPHSRLMREKNLKVDNGVEALHAKNITITNEMERNENAGVGVIS